MDAITIDSIKIIGISGILQIKNLELSVKPNEHARAVLSCLVDKKFMKECSASLHELIGIFNKIDDSCIFAGFLCKIDINKNGEGYQATFSLVSCSSVLDIEVKRRSFQKVSDTYRMLVDHVIKDTDGVWVNCNEGNNTTIDKPIFQYDETDWEFLKRLASNLNTVLLPELAYGTPQISFGVKKNNTGAKFTSNEYIKGISDKYYELGGSSSGYEKAYFNYWKVDSYVNLKLGDVVNFNGRDLVVIEKHGKLNKAELTFTYLLGYDTLFSQKKILNDKACGAALRGKVTDVVADKIKIQLDIDNSKDNQDLYYFDWAPITGNLLYCMPEIGSEVDLILNDCCATNPVALSCFRTNGSVCSQTADPLQKLLDFPTEKSLRLNDKEILMQSVNIASPKNIIQINDEENIRFDTQYSADITSLVKLFLNSRTVSINAPVQIEIKEIDQTGATISINQTIDINGNIYTIQAEDRIAYSPIDDAPTEIKLDKNKWWKLALKFVATVAFVALVAVVAVALAPATMAGAAFGAVCAAAAIGGFVAGGVTTIAQIISDSNNGINRNSAEYLYQFLDSFCTGAITSAPMALPGGGKLIGGKLLGAKLSGVGISSMYVQGVDTLLDHLFDGDFYDVDQTFQDRCFQVGTDMLSAYLGEIIVGGIDAGEGILNKFKNTGRQQYRAMAKKLYNDYNAWRQVANKYGRYKKISISILNNRLFSFLTNKYSKDIISAVTTSAMFTDIDEYECEPYTVIEFDEKGDFKFEEFQFE